MSRLKAFWAAYRPEVVWIALILAADRASKVLALDLLAPVGSVQLAPFFRLTYVQNTGAAFGSFQGANALVAAGAVAVLLLLLKWRGELIKVGPLARYGLTFIIGGAIGNLYDRMVLGFVVDYFDFIIWPVFNIADSFITVGAVMLGASMFWPRKPAPQGEGK